MALFKDLFKRSNVEDETDEMDAEIDDVYYGGHSDDTGRNARNDDDPYNDRQDNRSNYEDTDARYDEYMDGYNSDITPVKPVREDEKPARTTTRNVGYKATKPSDDDGYYFPGTARVTPPVEPPKPVNAGTLYFLPLTYAEDREAVAAGLREGHVVVIGVSRLDRPSIMRLYDFISGLSMALEAELFRLDPTTVVLVPKDVEIDRDEFDLPKEFDEDDADVEDVEEEEA